MADYTLTHKKEESAGWVRGTPVRDQGAATSTQVSQQGTASFHDRQQWSHQYQLPHYAAHSQGQQERAYQVSQGIGAVALRPWPSSPRGNTTMDARNYQQAFQQEQLRQEDQGRSSSGGTHYQCQEGDWRGRGRDDGRQFWSNSCPNQQFQNLFQDGAWGYEAGDNFGREVPYFCGKAFGECGFDPGRRQGALCFAIPTNHTPQMQHQHPPLPSPADLVNPSSLYAQQDGGGNSQLVGQNLYLANESHPKAYQEWYIERKHQHKETAQESNGPATRPGCSNIKPPGWNSLGLSDSNRVSSILTSQFHENKLKNSQASRPGSSSSNKVRQPGQHLLDPHPPVNASTGGSQGHESVLLRRTSQTHTHYQAAGQMKIPYPKSLSPSSIATFKQCPQSFLFQYLLGLKQPINPALAKGTMCHAALEQVFELTPKDRTLENLKNVFRCEWGKYRLQPPYDQLFRLDGNPNIRASSQDISAEAIWVQEAMRLLEQYTQTEDPAMVPYPNPVKREFWVTSHLKARRMAGFTGFTATTTTTITSTDSTVDAPASDGSDKDTFLVSGIIDRVDVVWLDAASAAAADRVVLRLIDYKTGKAPLLKYSPAVNRRIQAEAFEQLLIYALLWQKQKHIYTSNSISTLPVRFLRLFYLNSHASNAQQLDMDLGATAAERHAVLERVHADLDSVWIDLMELVSTQDATAWRGCDRPFCYCHSCRVRFVPGTVWEPSATRTGNSLPQNQRARIGYNTSKNGLC